MKFERGVYTMKFERGVYTMKFERLNVVYTQ